jgi:hypothetical protein
MIVTVQKIREKSFHTERKNKGSDPMAGMIKSNFPEHCESKIT